MSDRPAVTSDALARGAMQAALTAARQGVPSPNPHVGAAIVRDGDVIAVGWHRRPGDDHAEVMALREAGDRARGAELYVTLEPCNHHGRTPPCTDAIVRAGIARVLYAVRDPNPAVTGGGAEALRSQGVPVTEGFEPDLQAVAVRDLAPWRTFVLKGRSHVTLKSAMTLDGRIATRTGESRWITGEAARLDGHGLRASVDAILVGSRTVALDNPELTARGVPVERQPVRVVVDSGLNVPMTSRLVRGARELPTWMLTADGNDPARIDTLRASGIEVLVAGARGEKVDLGAALRLLASKDVVRVLCEGGGGLHGALLDAGVADRVVCYLAPMLFGGHGGSLAFGGEGVNSLAEAHRLAAWQIRPIGEDLRIEAELVGNVHGDHPGGR